MCQKQNKQTANPNKYEKKTHPLFSCSLIYTESTVLSVSRFMISSCIIDIYKTKQEKKEKQTCICVILWQTLNTKQNSVLCNNGTTQTKKKRKRERYLI